MTLTPEAPVRANPLDDARTQLREAAAILGYDEGIIAMLATPRREVTVLNMSVEDGLKLVMSGGIVVPPDRRPTLVEPPTDENDDDQPDRKVLAAASRSKR